MLLSYKNQFRIVQLVGLVLVLIGLHTTFELKLYTDGIAMIISGSVIFVIAHYVKIDDEKYFGNEPSIKKNKKEA